MTREQIEADLWTLNVLIVEYKMVDEYEAVFRRLADAARLGMRLAPVACPRCYGEGTVVAEDEGTPDEGGGLSTCPNFDCVEGSVPNPDTINMLGEVIDHARYDPQGVRPSVTSWDIAVAVLAALQEGDDDV